MHCPPARIGNPLSLGTNARRGSRIDKLELGIQGSLGPKTLRPINDHRNLTAAINL